LHRLHERPLEADIAAIDPGRGDFRLIGKSTIACVLSLS
jgi:hypothetical protein